MIQLGRGEVELTDVAAIRLAFDTYRPQVAINVAAYTAVDRAEDEPALAHAVNAAAPAAMAACARESGCVLIHVSTDYVFGGRSERPWREDDPIAPLNAYGRTKAEGEAAIRTMTDRHVILRTAWCVQPVRP